MVKQKIKTVLDVAAALNCADTSAEKDQNRINNTYFLLELADALNLIGGADDDEKRENGVRFICDLAEYMKLTSSGLYIDLGLEVSPEEYRRNDMQFLLSAARNLSLIVPGNSEYNADFLCRLSAFFGLTDCGKDSAERSRNNVCFLVDLANRLGLLKDFDFSISETKQGYSTVETDREFIIRIDKNADKIEMVKSAFDAIYSSCAEPLDYM